MAFVKTRSRTELWPVILEKAYAKKYGSFSTIEGGLVDVALAELTNGIPESWHSHETENKNATKFWKRIVEI